MISSEIIEMYILSTNHHNKEVMLQEGEYLDHSDITILMKFCYATLKKLNVIKAIPEEILAPQLVAIPEARFMYMNEYTAADQQKIRDLSRHPNNKMFIKALEDFIKSPKNAAYLPCSVSGQDSIGRVHYLFLKVEKKGKSLDFSFSDSMQSQLNEKMYRILFNGLLEQMGQKEYKIGNIVAEKVPGQNAANCVIHSAINAVLGTIGAPVMHIDAKKIREGLANILFGKGTLAQNSQVLNTALEQLFAPLALKGAGVDEKMDAEADMIDKRDKEGNTALMRAVKSNQAAEVLALLERGATIEIPNNAGETPLTVSHDNRGVAISSLITDTLLQAHFDQLAVSKEKPGKRK